MYCSGSNLRLISKLVGHLMIQSASKLDYYVVVLSNSDKRDAAIKLGANEFLIFEGAGELQSSRKIDRLVVSGYDRLRLGFRSPF